MAAELIGGSLLSSIFQVLFQRMDSPEVAEFFKGQILKARHLNKLNTTLISCNSVVDDAEQKQIAQPAVKSWLNELKDAVFEAEDLLDEIGYKNLQYKLEQRSSKQKVQDFLSAYNPWKKGTGERLKEILKRLQYLVKQKDLLGLKELSGKILSSQKISTTSVIDDSSFCGREDEKEAIVKLLLLDDDANGNDLSVIPIVGMAGIGKTALAQVVYNDSRVEEWFAIRGWVCVSEEFDVFEITKDILKEVTSEVTCDAKTHNQIQLELKQKLKGRKFLLVLDNVWNENYADWDFLRRPLQSGAKGSKILVTTRNDTVASIMRTVPSHHLKQLSDDDCWFLLAKHAFDNEDSYVHPKLKEIGREIVRKCCGLPLAAKALGGLLHSKRDAKEWEMIMESSIWDLTSESILPALKVSYHHLPSHLKRCFAYCAIFPKNYEFEKEELILLWMAEDFLAYPKGSKEIEKVGDDYFHEFVSRSFFQQSDIHQSHFGMHDLINDLAKSIAGEVYSTLEDDNDSGMISRRTRHLSYARSEYDVSDKFECIYEAEFLRTFLPLNSFCCTSTHCIDIEIIFDLIPTLTRLRVLSLSQYGNVVDLPNSIGKLKHLRYLNLQGTSIKRLPEYLSNLYNLQTAILHGCRNLVELPANMARLINLLHLDIKETKLQEMPPGMGSLTKLQKLTDFIVGKENGSSITELGKLQNLHGEICIRNLQNVLDTRHASKTNLKGKKHLKELTLRWDGKTHDPEHQRGVLAHLQPHWNIERLSIVGYGGSSFPDWVGDSSFSNIISLSLSGWENCISLPPLGQLASLKYLCISAFDRLMTIGLEFYGCRDSMIKPFPSLEIIKFERMEQWQEWISHEGEAFPLLRELYIRECPNLEATLHSHLPCLTTVEIEECQKLTASFAKTPTICEMRLKDSSRDMQIKKLPSGLYLLKVGIFHSLGSIQETIQRMGYLLSTLEEIDLKNCDAVETFPLELFPCLKNLRISKCSHLKSMEIHFQDFTSLRVLEIKKCPNFVSFPGNLWASNLSRLQLQGCSSLKWLPENMEFLLPSLVDMEIGNCPETDVRWWKSSIPSKLESISIWDCTKLIDHLMRGHLLMPSTLSCFHVGVYESAEIFPQDKLGLSSTLTSLKIWSFENLKYLDYEQLQELTSLKALTIINCPLLQFKPGEQLPLSLVTLRICDLKNLTSLDELGLIHLSSLRELTIIDCPNIESMPEKGLPSSISTLSIWKCPLLEQRCQQEKGEDWSKISHIPHINIYVHKIN